MKQLHIPTGCIMYSISLLMIFCLILHSYGTYYHPAVIWDLNNPILQMQYWTNVVQVTTFDEVTFVCAHEVLSMSGHDSKAYNSKLKNNLFVKEVSPDITDFDHACGAQGAKLLKSCNDPKKLMHRPIQINTIQAQVAQPIFVKGKDYMFFANSDGTEESLTTSSNNCTMVFRIHFCAENEDCSRSSCYLMGRKKVCEKNSKTNYSDCIPSAPRAVENTKSTNTTMYITWKHTNTTGCNITYYSICYRASTENDCKEILVPSSQRSVMLENLSPSTEYRIRVGAHFCTGSANYSEEIHGNTTEMMVFKNETSDPTTSTPKIKPSTKRNTDTKPTNSTTNPTTNPTTNYTEYATVLPRIGNKTPNVDPASIAIGFVIGMLIALGCVTLIWFLWKVRRQRCSSKEDNNCNTNEPTVKFDQEDDSLKMTTNIGYRQSITSNWPLQQIREDGNGEDHSLYTSSDA